MFLIIFIAPFFTTPFTVEDLKQRCQWVCFPAVEFERTEGKWLSSDPLSSAWYV